MMTIRRAARLLGRSSLEDEEELTR